ncbi:MAG: hypothetical protein QMD36_04335 [Candidatus Aenigmarchaeota archaeon]|nr:hypothetical protein [Candidatus Aenigmarchaeota archaeon]
MGMYDNFVPSERIVCPLCKKDMVDDDPDFPNKCILQSKALECTLNIYINKVNLWK